MKGSKGVENITFDGLYKDLCGYMNNESESID
jgi:hypothetical protein